MTVAVIGKENSGKSAMAETLAIDMAGNNQRIYLATMQVFDLAGEERVKKHRKMREGKGFITCEWPSDLKSHEDFLIDYRESVALLECATNLIGNEMYAEKNSNLNDEDLTKLCVEEICWLNSMVSALVVVTNEFAEDDSVYDAMTIRYIRVVNMVNERLKLYADRVIDVRK